MKYLTKIIVLLVLIPLNLGAREVVVEETIEWGANVESQVSVYGKKSFLAFKNAQYDDKKDYLPFFSKQIQLNLDKIVDVQVVEIQYEQVDPALLESVSGKAFIPSNIDLTFSTHTSKKVNYGVIRFTPIIEDEGVYKRVVSIKLSVNAQKDLSLKRNTNKAFANGSVLETGEWYKIAVTKDGIFKIDYNFLKNMGLDIDNLNPANFKLYGNGGKMLPADNGASRPDDLQQNAVFVAGEIDGSFDQGDYVLFYGQSPHSWTYNSATGLFEHENHIYSDSTFYYITFSNTGEPSKRVQTQASASGPNMTVTTFNDFAFNDRDAVNLIKSGSMWFGDIYDVKTSYTYSFAFPNIDNTSPVTINFRAAGRSGSGSSFTCTYGSGSTTQAITAVNMSSYTSRYANIAEGTVTSLPSNDVVSVNMSYSKPTLESIGWLDELEVNARRNMNMSGDRLYFRDVQSVGIGNVATFSLTNAQNVVNVWEITDPYNIKDQQFTMVGSSLQYNAATDSLRTFVAFTSNHESQVFPVGRVDNQNLHGIMATDMIIVTHPAFLTQASTLATFHEDEGLDVTIVTPEQVYNEFSSGSRDIVAIRDFVRMLYERAITPSAAPKYLLLFGDGSYDNKSRYVGNSNLLPTYQTPNSIDVIGSLVSDDYYGLLDVNEGTWITTEFVDIAIGRFPVKSATEANNVVNKILNYNTSNSMQDWRNLITFIGDDEDNNTHMQQSNTLAGIVESNYLDYNVDKIFFDAYQQESTPGGSRYPEVNTKINKAVEDGSLIVNYTGHGGEAGWGHERVLLVSDIDGWENTNSYPLFVTATCEFSRFDDPARTSAGELVLLDEHGGIGLMTTVRLVFSSPNFVLNQSFFNEVFVPNNGVMPTMGEVFLTVKNQNAGVANNRNFTLLGDPALRLAYPEYNAVTTQIDGNNVSASDTLRALQKVTITGEVRDGSGVKMTNFNGVIYPTVFDKPKQLTCFANDGGNPFSFGIQTNKLFKGKVSVTNGDYSYTFVVPKDISYNYGNGKLSYYTEDQSVDGNGYHNNFYIGGTAANYAEDNTGPDIDLFMNDENFVFGGMTDENPILLANLFDENGINMTGNGIGHDIVAILDGETENSFVLNDYYEADLNSYQNGKVYFPFENLSEGRHTLTVKVWDVYNNSSEATIEFVVVKSKDIVLDRVYNYPNPFTTYTEFWFEHNQPGQAMYAQVQIFTVSGKLVKTIEKHILNEGYRSNSITWNGLDEYGDKIGRGVYVYRLKVRADNYSVAEKYEKLVILN